jgi:glycosyltransferase involved in cell wall biosynthesis
MEKAISVFILVAHGYGGKSWHDRWQNGKIIGLNEPFAYGYHRASSDDLNVTYSEDCNENIIQKAFRLGLRVVLGFDVVHAMRHRDYIKKADAVWTHTESQGLAVAAVLYRTPKHDRPVLIFQSIWLMDKWKFWGHLRQMVYQKLLSIADILSFHSDINQRLAQDTFVNSRCELILFGINSDAPQTPREASMRSKLNIIAPGNDRHRDWETLAAAVRGMPDVKLTIVSQKCPEHIAQSAPNIKIESPANNAALFKLYYTCDGVIVPLTENMHASGITVIEEAAQRGRPVIASDVGGLRSYFGDDAVNYVPSGDISSLQNAIRELTTRPEAARNRVLAAQKVMGPGGLNAKSYAMQHAKWTRELVKLKETSVSRNLEK